MIYIPWADYGICPHWMLGRCNQSATCKWDHPPASMRKQMWEEWTAAQDAAAARGIPRPQPRPKRKRRESEAAVPSPPQVSLSSPGSIGRNAKLWDAPSTPRGQIGSEVRPTKPSRRSDDLTSARAFKSPRINPPGTPGSNGAMPEIEFSFLGRAQMCKGASNGAGEQINISKSEGEEEEVTGSREDVGVRANPHRTSQTAANSTPSACHFPALSPPKMGAAKRTSDGETKAIGPHPSTIRVNAPYISQAAADGRLRPSASSGLADTQGRSQADAREETIRLQGVAWIDNVRRALDLPVRTFTTACTNYHKFRLQHPQAPSGVDYGGAWMDTCAASLLQACKVEDTLKKSRDILCAAYNLKASAHDRVNADDPMFEAQSRLVIGLERLVLEAAGFDFRSKHPHELLVKLARTMSPAPETKTTAAVAFSVMSDLHRTFVPLKQTSATMAFASLELAAHLVATTSPNNSSVVRDELPGYDLDKWSTSRGEIMETLLDALDLYTHHTQTTILGPVYRLDDFLRIRLAFNKECTESNIPRHTTAPESTADRQQTNGGGSSTTLRVANGHPTPISPPQAGTHTQQQQQQQQAANGATATAEGSGTLRFMLDPHLATSEKACVQKFYVEEWEEYEEEIEVPLVRARSRSPRNPRSSNNNGNQPFDRTGREEDRGREKERERERLRDRQRELEREQARLREREREQREGGGGGGRRRYEDRGGGGGGGRYEDRGGRYDDRRERRYDERRYDDDRRRERR